jgi:hypothetical protein
MSDLAIHGGGQARLAARGLGRLTFLVEPVPPFRLDLTVWALRRRASNAVDRWDGTIGTASRSQVAPPERAAQEPYRGSGGSDPGCCAERAATELE